MQGTDQITLMKPCAPSLHVSALVMQEENSYLIRPAPGHGSTTAIVRFFFEGRTRMWR